jgi:hypothetical protein
MKIVIDSGKRSIDINQYDLISNSLDIEVHLEIDGATQTSFVDFSFEMNISDTSEYSYLYNSLDIGKILKMSKNPFTSITLDDLEPNTEYTVNVIATDQDGSFDNTFTFITSLPPAPFESWTYDLEANEWFSPKEMPNDNGSYIWNDFTKEWEVAIFPIN